MSTGKWRPEIMRGIQKKGPTYWLRLYNDGKWRVYNLGRDEVEALRQARDIRKGIDPTVEAAINWARQDPAKKEDRAEILSYGLSDLYGEEVGGKAYSRAMGKDALLEELIDGPNAPEITPGSRQTKLDAIKRSGLRWLSDCPDRQSAYSIMSDLKLKGYKPNTIVLTASILASLYSTASDLGIWQKPNPFAGLRQKSARTTKRAMSPEEFQSAINGSSSELVTAWITLLCLCGFRISEAVSCHLVDNEFVISAGKTETSQRKIPATPVAKAAFEMIRAEPLAARAVQGKLRGLFDDLGLKDVDTHSCRRTCAQALGETNCPEHIAAAILGHRHSAITFGRYATRGPTYDQKLKALEKVEDHLFGRGRPHRHP